MQKASHYQKDPEGSKPLRIHEMHHETPRGRSFFLQRLRQLRRESPARRNEGTRVDPKSPQPLPPLGGEDGSRNASPVRGPAKARCDTEAKRSQPSRVRQQTFRSFPAGQSFPAGNKPSRHSQPANKPSRHSRPATNLHVIPSRQTNLHIIPRRTKENPTSPSPQALSPGGGEGGSVRRASLVEH